MILAIRPPILPMINATAWASIYYKRIFKKNVENTYIPTKIIA